MKLLVIEDNPRLADKIRQQLQKWYVVEVALSGDAGLALASATEFNCILLDLGLPDATGSQVCRRIRSLDSGVPILVLTGIDTTESRVELLDGGADDYLTKPFDIAELRARINALIRRRVRTQTVPIITVGDLVLDPAKRSVTRAGAPIQLRKKEFDILEYLALNPNRVLSRQMIINHAWVTSSKSWTGSVDVHIKQLRDKIDKPFAYPLIKTSYGVGYMVEIPSDTTKKKGVTT